MKVAALKIGVIFIMCSAFIFGKTKLFHFPKHFPKPVYDFEKNPLSKNKIELGRMLFYDPILSKDNTISCASCHSPYNAFAHTDHSLSHGIDNQIGTRNAPALFNLAWQSSFMWDGSINHIDVQPLAPITHPKEMNESLENIVIKLQQKKIYKAFFSKMYKDSTITGERILKALSAFQLTLISATSKYDLVQTGKEKFNAKEEKGYKLFKTNCSACHTEPLFSNYAFKNNGLPIDTTLKDYGLGAITKQQKDSLLFKVPSLRNLSYTYPYMHDGRYNSLNEVLNHYNSLQKNQAGVSVELTNGIHLSSNEKTELITFLLTLTDEKFVFDLENKFPRKKLISKE